MNTSEAGLCVPPRDVEVPVGVMSELIKTPTRRRTMETAALSKAEGKVHDQEMGHRTPVGYPKISSSPAWDASEPRG